MPVACAVEMVHTMFLMQDDLPCMDNDVLWRRKPSSHVVFGENVTLLAAVALLALAFEHIETKTVGVPPLMILSAIGELARSIGAKEWRPGSCLT